MIGRDVGVADGTRVACCQCVVADLDVARNLDHVDERVRALPDDVDVALFPELALTGFVDDERIRATAIARDGPELERVCETATATGTALLVGFAERADGQWFNATAYVTPGGETTVYRKRNLWGAEREWFTPGDRRVVVETPVGRTGLLTCYDLNFVSESAWFTDERVDALFVVGAWPAEHAGNWRLLCRARALDGARLLVACGRTGSRTAGPDPVASRPPDGHGVDGRPGDGDADADADAEADADGPARYAGASAVVRPNGDVARELGRDARDLLGSLDPDRFHREREEVGIFTFGRSTGDDSDRQ